WADGGMAAGDDAAGQRLRRGGLTPMDPDAALRALQRVLARDLTGVVVADVDWPVFTGLHPSRLIADLPEVRAIQRQTPAVANRDPDSLRSRLAGMSEADQSRTLLEVVRCDIAAVLRSGFADDIGVGRAFRELGFDSLMAMELKNRLTRSTGVALPATLVYDYPTTTAVVDHLRAALVTGSDSRDRVAVAATGSDEPIAIVGMACRFPAGVTTPEQFWDLLAAGGDGIGEFPADRGWDLDGIYHPDPEHHDTTYVREGGFIDATRFDPGFFGISAREALAMDPQQRLLLETAWELFERAGIDPESLRGSATGVFAGSNTQDYKAVLDRAGDDVAGHALTGNAASVVSGRLSYLFGLEGPAVTVDTACSSSLVALHMAVQSLRSGESSLALAGGVTVMSTPYPFVEFSRQRGLAADGRCKPFAAAADGTSWSEGVGLLLVERLSDAQRLGHDVLALVSGTAVNQDGSSNGLTAPNGPSQQRVIRQALANAGLSAGEVDVVEAHGTGTTLGDPIEAQALLATYGQDRDQPVLLGSVKSNIGHTQAAAGVAGIIKMVLAMRHGVVPKSLHIDAPSPHVDWTAGAMALAAEHTDWPESDHPRRAAVSSFGVSGTNAHVIIEQAPAAPPTEAEPGPATALPWVLSAKSAPALRDQAARLAAFLRGNEHLHPADIGYTLATARTAMEHRGAIVATDRDGYLRGLDALAEGGIAPGLVEGTAAGWADGADGVVFVFPGQGAQWAAMAAELIESSPVFAERIRECATALSRYVDWSLLGVLRGADDAPPLDRVDVVQPVLFAMMVSLAEVWRGHGVQPTAVVGHSQGEIAAACVAGALSLDDAARVVALRSRIIARDLAGRGGMVSVAQSAAETRDRIGRWADRLSIATVNGPRAVVVAGEPDALTELIADCEQDGVRAKRVPVDYASHCEYVEAIEESLLAALQPIEPRPATVPYYSAVTGGRLDTTGLDAGYWYRNLRQTVEFEQATLSLLGDGLRIFVEVSPHPVVIAGLQETADAAGV
ncbi:MAG: candicidin polyketide synthase FscB, partial [Actinoplanes sp.]|nr:candicidin polyketide synthase FscB [Actinoplanes sp.]